MSGDLGFVLLPGAGLGTYIWDPVIERLGDRAVALDIPGRGATVAERRRLTLASAAAVVANEIAGLPAERVVVVGHSIGGVLVPAVASRLGERVAALVFVSAGIPGDRVRYLDVLPRGQRLFIRLLLRLRPAGVRPPASAIGKELCNDLDQATTARVVERFEPVPEAPYLYREAVSWSGVPDVPRLYVQLLRDQAVAPERQAEMAERIDAEVVTLGSGHLPMLSRPQELAGRLDQRYERAPSA